MKKDKDTKLMPDARIEQYKQEWEENKSAIDVVIRDFKKLDTITNAQFENTNKRTPNIGDTTVAGEIRDMIRSSVKDIPAVEIEINGSAVTPEAMICKAIVEDRILNPITFGNGFLGTLQLGGRGSISRGFNVFQVAAKSMYGEYGIIPKLIHYNDFVIENGVQNASTSQFFQIRVKMTPGKLRSIYNAEKKKKVSTWNIKALEALLAIGPDSSGSADYGQYLTPMEQWKLEAGATTFDIITRYSIRTKEPIVTYSPVINQPLREVENRSKFGFPRVLFLVIDPAELTPYGDSRVRLATPNSNFLMTLRQNVGTTWMYNSNPAVVKRGQFTGAVALKSGAVLESTDTQADVKVLTMDTTTAQQYPTISSSIEAQIRTMLGRSTAGNLGAIGESKTGVGAQKQAQGIDNANHQITKIMENFLCQYVLSGLDLYLSEQEGDDIIYVNDSTRNDIAKIRPDAFPDPSNPNALHINWEQLYDYVKKINVKVIATMSKEEWSDEKRADLQNAAAVIGQTADPNDPIAQERKKIIEDKVLSEAAPELSHALNTNPPQMPQPQAEPSLTQQL